MPYRDHFPPCPRCKCALSALKLATGHTIASCPRCDGNWTTPDQFRAVAAALVPGSRPPRIDKRNDYEPVLACSVCNAPMAKVKVGGAAIDWCRPHGAWFDFGELQRVLSSLALR